MTNFDNAIITAQSAPGTTLYDCFNEAFQTVSGGNTVVKFKFNGVEIIVDKYSTLDSVNTQYKRKLYGE